MTRGELIDERLTHSIIGAFYEVYNTLGYGLYEQIYAAALDIELRARGHHVEREVRVEICYKGTKLGSQRLDMLVDHRVIVETKATAELHRGAIRQLQSYLCASGLDVGLPLHFGPEPIAKRITQRNDRRSKTRTHEDLQDLEDSVEDSAEATGDLHSADPLDPTDPSDPHQPASTA